MKSVIYALISVPSLVTVLHVSQFNVFNINLQLPASQSAITMQPTPPASPCGSEYECQRIEQIQNLSKAAEEQCVTVTRESTIKNSRLVQDTITTHSKAVRIYETSWHCKMD